MDLEDVEVIVHGLPPTQVDLLGFLVVLVGLVVLLIMVGQVGHQEQVDPEDTVVVEENLLLVVLGALQLEALEDQVELGGPQELLLVPQGVQVPQVPQDLQDLQDLQG